MENFLIIFGALMLIICPPVIWLVIRYDNKKLDATFHQYYDKLYGPLMEARKIHTQNMEQLNKIGFHADRSSNVGHKHFLFDYTKTLMCFEEFYIDDGFLQITKRNYGQLIPFVDRGASFCRWIKVFCYDKIVDCVLIQDGSVVKSSEGSAFIAGTSVPMLGVLQGKASSSSGEHQTGIIAVRLTLDDIQNPSILFTFNSGNMDKSSTNYTNNFQQAQEVFGIFDAIVRINLKATGSAASKASSTGVAAAQPAAQAHTAEPKISTSDTVFDKIRQIGKLKDEGLLTEDEFAQKKKLLMDQIK